MQYQNLKDISEHVNDLVSLLSENTGIIDLQPPFFNFTLSTTTALIFGRSVASLSEEKQEAFGRNFDYASAICAMRIPRQDITRHAASLRTLLRTSWIRL